MAALENYALKCQVEFTPRGMQELFDHMELRSKQINHAVKALEAIALIKSTSGQIARDCLTELKKMTGEKKGYGTYNCENTSIR